MGNCVLKGINITTRHGISTEKLTVKVVTSSGGIMELYTPITVDFITSEFPGYGIFHCHDDDFFSSEPQPMLENEQLHAGEVYHLLPLKNCPSASDSSSCGVMTSSSRRKSSIMTRQVSNASSISTPYRMFTYEDNNSNGTTNKIRMGSEPEILPRHNNNKSSGGVWKVRLVIRLEQLSEILSEESLTEALIESLRTVAKCTNGNGVPNSLMANSGSVPTAY